MGGEAREGLAALAHQRLPLTDFGLSSNRHKDQAPAGVTYGFPPTPAGRPPAAGADARGQRMYA